MADAKLCLDSLQSKNIELQKFMKMLEDAEGRMKQCETARASSAKALSECQVARDRPSTNIRNFPEGRLTYKGCFRDDAAKGSVVERNLGNVSAEGGVLECSALAMAAKREGEDVIPFGLLGGNQCVLFKKDNVTKYGSVPGGCSTFDSRGTSMGGGSVQNSFAMYTLEPRGLMGRSLKVVHRANNGLPLQIAGLTAYDANGRVIPIRSIRAVDSSGKDLDLSTGEAGSTPDLVGFARDLNAAGAQLSRMLTFVDLGSAVGNSLLVDLSSNTGAGVRVDAIDFRPRFVPGNPDIEKRIVGCSLQLLNSTNGVVFERMFTESAPHYRFDVR